MKITDFHALHPGTVRDGEGDEVTLSVHDLGTLRVPSGRVRVCDPFVNLDDCLEFAVPPGDYPVRVTMADCEAYFSLVLAEGEAASVEPAASVEGAPEPGTCWLVPVDAGTVGMVDADAVERCMPELNDECDWYEEIFDSGEPTSWFELMDSEEHYQPGLANIVMPLATHGENVVMSHSGFGDGSYPVYLTRDAAGRPLGLHIDLLLIAPGKGEDDAEDAG